MMNLPDGPIRALAPPLAGRYRAGRSLVITHQGGFMKRSVALLAALLVLAGALAAASQAQDAASDEGFVQLFNGKDLTGWQYKGSKESLEGKTATPDERVKVEDGVIVMQPKDNKGKGGIKDLNTVKSYPKNFHLRLEFRASEKSDSGVYVRGPQLQVRD